MRENVAYDSFVVVLQITIDFQEEAVIAVAQMSQKQKTKTGGIGTRSISSLRKMDRRNGEDDVEEIRLARNMRVRPQNWLTEVFPFIFIPL